MLQEWGHCYVPEAIVHSELRVLKTIDFALDLANPLTYIELLWKLIGKTCHYGISF